MAPWAEGELEGFMPVLEAFMEQNPNIKVEYRTGRPEDTATMLANQFAIGKTSADIIDTPWSWFIVQQAQAGHIMQMNDVIGTDEFLPGSLKNVSIGDDIYGASSVGGVTIPEYRKSFFADNDLRDPADLTSWAEFIELLDAIAAIEGVQAPIGSGGGVGWSFTSIVEAFIITFGGPEMHIGLSEGSISWIDPSVKEVFTEYLLPLLQQGYFGEPDEYTAVLEAMWSGKHGIYIGDSTDNLSLSPSDDRAVFTLPGQEAVVLWNDFWYVPKYTEHPEEAKKLFRFLATEGQKIQIANGGRIGTYAAIPLEMYPQSEREVFEVIKDKIVLPDMDDTIGGKFQTVIWDQLGLLWSNPTERTLDGILLTLQQASEETLGN
jgi:multiple sugar transport system substrate-binding protein